MLNNRLFRVGLGVVFARLISLIMAEQLPWIPSPLSPDPRIERTTLHRSDDGRRQVPLYSQVLTSTSTSTSPPITGQKVPHHTAEVSVVDRDGGKFEVLSINDVTSTRTRIQNSESSYTKSRVPASPRLRRESLPDNQGRNNKSLIGAPITTANSPSDTHNYKVQ